MSIAGIPFLFQCCKGHLYFVKKIHFKQLYTLELEGGFPNNFMFTSSLS